MKVVLLALLALALADGPPAKAQDTAWMSGITVDCASFFKLGPSWIALKETVVSIKVEKKETTMPLTKGTKVNLLLAEGVYLGELLEKRCPNPVELVAPHAVTTATAPPAPEVSPRRPKAQGRPLQGSRPRFSAEY
jgi:hypothetical protein